jgi:hypothetical protein
MDLPAAAGTMARPPQFACYLLFNIGTTAAPIPVWTMIGDPLFTYPNSSCTLATGANGVLRIIAFVPTTAANGQGVAFVAIY